MKLTQFKPRGSAYGTGTLTVGKRAELTSLKVGLIESIEALPEGVLVTGDKGCWLFTAFGEGMPAPVVVKAAKGKGKAA